MQHFLDVNQLTSQTAHDLFERAFTLKKAKTYPNDSNIKLLNLFYEDSTRTRLSFELAAKNLGFKVLSLDPKRSSETKGESMLDMLHTVAAMGVNIVVIRHPDNHVFDAIKASVPTSLSLINAGCGMFAHPTQAMLDVMTMLEQNIKLEKAKITVIGDIVHSRVAGSLQRLSAILGVKDLVFTGPKPWLPNTLEYGRMTESLSDALSDADVVMALRVQRERFTTDEDLDFEAYREHYALTEHALAYAKPNAIVMHPGPINRGVEIDSMVADGPQSCILKQVENGVFIRMAILEHARSGML